MSIVADRRANAAERARRHRARRKCGARMVWVEIDAEVIDELIDVGRLPEWSDADRDAIGIAIGALLRDWARAVTRNAADPLRFAKNANRDDPLADIVRSAARFYLGDASAIADAMAADLRRYADGPWRHDRLADECPARWAGTKYGELWQLLRIARAPLSGERIHQMLGG